MYTQKTFYNPIYYLSMVIIPSWKIHSAWTLICVHGPVDKVLDYYILETQQLWVQFSLAVTCRSVGKGEG